MDTKERPQEMNDEYIDQYKTDLVTEMEAMREQIQTMRQMLQDIRELEKKYQMYAHNFGVMFGEE